MAAAGNKLKRPLVLFPFDEMSASVLTLLGNSNGTCTLANYIHAGVTFP